MRAACLPSARASVIVDGAALTEYSTESDDGTGAITFVEAIPGTTFAVEMQLDHPFPHRNANDRLIFSVYLDGEFVRSSFIYGQIASVVDGTLEIKNGESLRRAFKFTEHATTDGHADASLIHKLASIGEIKIEVQKCREKGVYSPGDTGSGFNGIGDNPIPEKATKGRSISNHAELGPRLNTGRQAYARTAYPYGRARLATYKFQYRSRRDLEIEGIVERPPSPAPPVKIENRDPADLTLDEAREQLRLLRAREAANNIKQEFQRENRKRERSVTSGQENGSEKDNNDRDDDEVTITAEWDRRKRAKASAEGAEVIDLTED